MPSELVYSVNRNGRMPTMLHHGIICYSVMPCYCMFKLLCYMCYVTCVTCRARWPCRRRPSRTRRPTGSCSAPGTGRAHGKRSLDQSDTAACNSVINSKPQLDPQTETSVQTSHTLLILLRMVALHARQCNHLSPPTYSSATHASRTTTLEALWILGMHQRQ